MRRHDEMLLMDICRRNAKRYPNKEAMVYGDTRLTFEEFQDRTNRFANALIGLGIKKGDKVATLLNNSHWYGELYFSIPKSGAIMTPLNYRLAVRELAWIMNHAEAKVLILDEVYLQTIESIKQELKYVEKIILTGEARSEILGYEDLIAMADIEEPDPDVHDDEVVSIFYTSGTTGVPKGAMLTHRNLLSNCQNICIENKIIFGDTFLIVSPMYHTITPATMYAHMYRGNTNVAIDHFDPKLMVEILEKEKVTHLFLVPSMIVFTLEWGRVKEYDISNLKLIWYGGSSMPVDRIKQAMDVFGCDFGQGFGMTELGPCFVSVLSPEDHRLLALENDEEKLSSVGRNHSNTETKIVDDDDNEVPIGTIGEVCVRGPNVMKGYWKMPDETAEALKGGWFHTGDLGKMDGDGYLYVVDRKKDMIISGAENIYSAEVENVLSSHSAVLEVAVIGVPDEQWGESVKAIVVLREGMTVTEEGLIEYCKENLASYKKPKSVDFIEALTRNVMGKVLKTELREKYWKGYEKRVH